MYDKTTRESVDFVVSGMADLRRLDEYYKKISFYRPEIDRRYLEETSENHLNYLVEVVNSIYEGALENEKSKEKIKNEEILLLPEYKTPVHCHR